MAKKKKKKKFKKTKTNKEFFGEPIKPVTNNKSSLSGSKSVKSPTSPSTPSYSFQQLASPVSVPNLALPRFLLLNHIGGGGLGVSYQFDRQPSIYSSTMNVIRLLMENCANEPLKNICVGEQNLEEGSTLVAFPEVQSLLPGKSAEVNLHIDFNQKIRPAKFEICTNKGRYPVTITPPIGELLRGVPMSTDDFLAAQSKLRGMNESVTKMQDCVDSGNIAPRVISHLNVGLISAAPDDNVYRFAGKTMSPSNPIQILISVSKADDGPATVTVNCGDAILLATIVKAVVSSLKAF